MDIVQLILLTSASFANKLYFETGCFVHHLNLLHSGNCQSVNIIMILIKFKVTKHNLADGTMVYLHVCCNHKNIC